MYAAEAEKGERGSTANSQLSCAVALCFQLSIWGLLPSVVSVWQAPGQQDWSNADEAELDYFLALMKGPATSRRPDGRWLQSNDELRSDPWLQQLFQADESSKREAKKGLEEFRKLFESEPALKAKFPLWPPDISDFHEPSFWGLQPGLCLDLWASDHAVSRS